MQLELHALTGSVRLVSARKQQEHRGSYSSPNIWDLRDGAYHACMVEGDATTSEDDEAQNAGGSKDDVEHSPGTNQNSETLCIALDSVYTEIRS